MRETSNANRPGAAPIRLGCVSYLNAKPLIYGLEEDAGVRLMLDVPSRLLAGLREQRFDVALLPIIDYQRIDHVRLLSAGGIGSFGLTLTVRIFSRTPIDRIETLACDTDSHTSVALARIVLSEMYGRRPEFVVLPTKASPGEDDIATKLLIGDKVVCPEPVGYPHQLDLGAAWKELTGLPFLFAGWVARQDVELGDLSARLERAKRRGHEHLDEIIEKHARPRGWPGELARRYLSEHLQYDVGEAQWRAVALFHQYAARYGLVDNPPRPLVVE